jgi:DNA-binding IclR family transcriptional regulator
MKTRYRSSTIQKAFDILNLFKIHKKLKFAEIQGILNINKSTLFRILATLSENNFLQKDEKGEYELGINIFILGSRISTEYQLKNVALPFMRQLSENLDLTLHLGILESNKVVVIEKTDPVRNIKMISRIGESIPAHCTGQGKALLAFSPRDVIERIINAEGLKQYTPNTITTADQLMHELQITRERGYAIDNSEYEKNIKCVAVPIFGRADQIEGALSANGLVTDFPDDASIMQTAKRLTDLSLEITKKIGWSL